MYVGAWKECGDFRNHEGLDTNFMRGRYDVEKPQFELPSLSSSQDKNRVKGKIEKRYRKDDYRKRPHLARKFSTQVT